MSASNFTYEVTWSEEERTFIARVKEFSSLEARAPSRGGALRALKSVVYAVAKDLDASGAESDESPSPETDEPRHAGDPASPGAGRLRGPGGSSAGSP